MANFIGCFGSEQVASPALESSMESETNRVQIVLEDKRILTVNTDDKCIQVEHKHFFILFTADICYKLCANTEALAIMADDLVPFSGCNDSDYNQGISSILNGISGHFSCLIFDKKTGNLTLASDKMGTHPVYYTRLADTLCFSSKLGLIASSFPDVKHIDPQSIYHYVFFHCIPAPDTVYREVKKLNIAEQLTFSTTMQTQTWFIADFSVSEGKDKVQHGQLFNALENSVENALHPLDIEKTGAFLSGGLDSSTVAGFFARKAGAGKAKTFTIGFDAEGYDESEFARITADLFQTDHKVYYVTPDDIKEALEKIADYYDEPFGNSSALPAYYCARFARQNGVETLLAGDGGDELFAGNERYAKQKVFEWYFKIPSPVRKLLIELPLNLLPAEKIPGINKVASYVRQANTRLPARLHTYNFLHQFNPEDVFTETFIEQVDRKRPSQLFEARYNECKNADAQNRMLYLDWKFTLADNDLVKVTNMCNLAGVDVKYPMLDDELVLLSTRIPSETLLPGNRLRHFYKEAMRGFLSDKTLNKSKKGFGLPFGVWLKERPELRNMAYDNVRQLTKYDFFKESFLEHAIKMHSSDHPGYFGELIWILMMLNLWLKAHA
ncbi:MAG: asparagine synthase [Proteobacteria bacterium]|nr:MAG: asparagine synthase [Pseudomonadota bacterium]